MALRDFIRLVVNLYRNEPDDKTISIGDWLPSPVEGYFPIFHPIMRVTVGDFRRWAET